MQVSIDRRLQKAALQSWVRALALVNAPRGIPPTTLASSLDDLALTHGDRLALLGDADQFSYCALAALANRYARWTLKQGKGRGDVVCLLMPNSPKYAAVWLGISRTRCAVALINTNLVGEALLATILASEGSVLIVEASLVPMVEAIAAQLPAGLQIWICGSSAQTLWPRIESDIGMLDGARIGNTECQLPELTDRAILIFTSGTTGFPKAVNVTHGRVLEWSLWFAGMMDVEPADRLYDCLPMYHSTGGIVAIGAMLIKGGSVVIRARFSASRFWDDVTDLGCTIFQYIGELCRYLCQSPPHPKERSHRIRLACGNGLQAEVWKEFQSRFNVPKVLEFYAATEGVVSLYNCEGKPGAIGRIPKFLSHSYAVAIIRIDTETSSPLRDENGFCIACGDDEHGEAIGLLQHAAAAPLRSFDGYTDRVASELKVLRNVFLTGDKWFRTGDLMRRDSMGFFYFVDRIGDTYRWRGENVSTTQVNKVIRACKGVTDSIVYGVTVPGNEGRAGMAAICTSDDFDMVDLQAHLTAHLPVYAQPLFLRLSKRLEITSTFKLTTGTYAREGYARASEPVWFNDRASGRFVLCDGALLGEIEDGLRRL